VEKMLDERKQRILQAIINDYISTAEPIGSRTIARKYDLGVSSATIRNEMADLELLGYIEQLHTSSGRIPSSKGYRFYVDDLLIPTTMTENEITLIRNWYKAKVKRVEEVFQETAKLISRMTKNVSLVLAPQLSQAAFRCLQFLPLDAKRVIVVIMTDAGFIENKIIFVPSGAAFEDFQRMALVINKHLMGHTMDSITTATLRKIRDDIMDTSLFDAAMDVIDKALMVDKKERIYLGGTTQLLNQPEFRDVEKVKNILLMLEEEQLLCDILHSNTNHGLSVSIGHENKYSGIQDCSIISATYHLDGELLGTIAVLGPTRMEYGKTIALLDFMNENLSQVLQEFGW
jgi:heat-inducible transcriptional repressor